MPLINQFNKSFSISVVLPTWNRIERIKKCLPTFLATKVQDVQFIIIDNNSDDGTWDYLQSVALKDNRVEIHRNSQNIEGRTIFRGYCSVKSSYVLFLADDDMMEGDYIARCLEIFQKHDDVGLVHHFLGGYKTQQKFFNKPYSIYSKGTESITSLFMISGSYPGLAFRMKNYDLKNYPLGEKVRYPQTKIALEIASKHNTALIHDCGFISSGFEDTFLDNKKIQNRPDDMGINERLSYLLSIKNPILIQKLAMQLAGWSIEVFEDIEKLNPKEAKKLVKSLVFSLNNVTPYFIILLFKIKKFKYGIFSLICLIAKPSFLLNYIWFLMMIVDKIFTKIKTHKKN